MTHEHHYQKFLENNPYPRELKNYAEKQLLNFSSNDYLGIANHPMLISYSKEFAEKYGVGASSSRSVTGNDAIYETLEIQLAKAMGKPAALILGTGFQTNTSVLEALLNPEVIGTEPLVFCDRLCHVSMLASTRYLTRIKRFNHNDLNHLTHLLEKYADLDRPKFILVESVYSMDGDQANLATLIAIAKQFHAFLYVDDAHGVGIYGPSGWGKATEFSTDINLIMGTFSKALGSFGGYVACSETIRNYLINKCKGLIYSTALPPTVLGTIAAAIQLIPTLENERKKLASHAKKLREFFKQHGLDCGNSNTHIIPWIIGDADKTLYASKLLEKLGILGATIRPPSVPPGKSRIRFCLSAAHSDEEIDYLIESILKVEQKL